MLITTCADPAGAFRVHIEREHEKERAGRTLDMEPRALTAINATLLQSIAAGKLDRALFLHALSTVIGYFIVIGSATVAIPQIIRVLKNRSVKGLNVSAFELDALGYTFILSYSIHKGLPFSLFGEYIFLLSQSLTLVSLIYIYSKDLVSKPWLTRIVPYCLAAPVLICGHFSTMVYEVLYACQHGIFFLARARQILQNHEVKDTGELSFLTFFINFLRCSARIFTSIEAKAPANMVWGFVVSIFTSGAILAQIIRYKTLSIQKEKKTQ